MNRKEFIESCRNLTEAELQRIAVRARTMAEKRVPPEMTALFRTLDDVTTVEEIRVETAWGSSHVYVVQEKEHGADKRPVLVNVHGGGWTMPHTERDTYFCRPIPRLLRSWRRCWTSCRSSVKNTAETPRA